MELFVSIAETVAWIFVSYLLADFITGVIHWAEDTWTAPGRSKLLDRWIVLDNIEHHRRPGSIRGGSYWLTNRPSLCISAAIGIVLVICGVHAWQAYLTLAIASQGNQVHKWAHSSDRPAPVRWAQDRGLLQSRKHHGKHHTHPYAVHFCALTDYLNPVLDEIRFWRALEAIVSAFGATVTRGTQARHGL